MTARELQLNGMLYPLDKELWNAHINSKRITRLLNATLETEVARRKELVQELFAEAGSNAYVEPPFYCDYGRNTKVGDNFYCNYDCVFLDCGPITIGNDVWIGGSAVICPGVTIGDNTVIGAGSVVTKDIPSGVVAAGNPCRVIREITPEECNYWKEQFAKARALWDEE